MFSRSPFFCDYVVDYLKRDPALGKTPEDREDLLLSGGLTVQTTIDLRYQKAAEESVKAHVFPREEAIGGLAMVEPRSGNVKAIAQSRPMGRDKALGETFINYLVPKEVGGARGFQAGSTFKAFVLATAIKQGISLNTTINSPKIKTFQERDFEDCDGEPVRLRQLRHPQLHDLRQQEPLHRHPGVGEHLLHGSGADDRPVRAVPDGQGAGHQPDQPHRWRRGLAERVPTFTLGVADVTPLEMAEAYATFAGRGLHCSARPVTEILDARKNVIKAYPKECQQVLPSAVADAVNDVLRGVMEPGGFGNNAGINTAQISAGKTGTTNSQQSVWFVGYTPNLAAASMIAGANQEGSPDTIVGKADRWPDSLRGVRFGHRRPHVGRRDEGHRAVAARRGLLHTPGGPDHRAPGRGAGDVRHDHRPGHRGARGGRLHRGGGRRDRLATGPGDHRRQLPVLGQQHLHW